MAYGESSVSDVSADQGPPDEAGMPSLLSLCREELRRAIGFETDTELKADRERALNYYKGDVGQDIPSLENRSKAVSSDLSDAVETLLPDLMEIFIGGDDVVAFLPQNEQDVEPAQQETAYLNHVVFQENPGFLNFYTAIKDALLLKTGIFTWEYAEDIQEQSENFIGKNVVELQLAQADGTISNVKPEKADDTEQTYSFTVTKTKDNSKAKYWPVAPDDFAAAADTINIADTAYCVMRSRPRVQDLLAAEYDEDKVRSLEQYAYQGDQTIQLARDNAGENSSSGGVGDESSSDLRQVEIRKHHIRTLGKGGKLEIWCVVTDANATVELESYQCERIPYAIGSPYLIAHRLIGLSLADLLIEVMKIKTALTRAVLDSAYFSLNQRMEVSQDASNDYTLSDLLNNVPGMPIRSKNGQALRPINAAGLGFDPYGALEYFSTVAEGRTGVVRNAQGLNPDTLHDTASGAMMLLSAAQKRTKMIARVLAETLIKPFYLGMHAEIRENASAGKIANLLGKWVPIDPTKWADRDAMSVEVGLGASGKDMEIAAMNQIIAGMRSIVEEQGGASGPIVTLKNVYQAATDLAKKLGVKSPQEYFTDPSAPPDPSMPPPQPKPDPALIKVQGELQIAQQKLQSDAALESQKVQAKVATDQHLNQLEAQRQQQEQIGQMQLEQAKIASSERIAIAVARINAEAKIEAARVSALHPTDDGAAAMQYEETNESRIVP